MPAAPAEERFNQTHAYHGEFGSSGGTQKPPGKGPARQSPQDRKQALLQQAAQDRQQADTLKGQLAVVNQQISQYNKPYNPTGSAAKGKGSSAAAGKPSKGAAASGTKSYGKGGKGTKGGGGYNASKGPSYIQGLYSQAATLRGQIATLERQANELTRRANRL